MTQHFGVGQCLSQGLSKQPVRGCLRTLLQAHVAEHLSVHIPTSAGITQAARLAEHADVREC